MVIAVAAAWNGYRPMAPIDQTMHYLRPVNFDVVADARVVRVGSNTSFGRVMLYSAADKRRRRHGCLSLRHGLTGGPRDGHAGLSMIFFRPAFARRSIKPN